MKFKKEDLGLYVALGITGAGFGLLVGALLAARRVRWGKVDSDFVEPRILIPSEEIVEPEVERVMKDPEYSPELLQFIETYEPSAIQIQMVLVGAVTLEDLKDLIEQETLMAAAEPYTYQALYRPTSESSTFNFEVEGEDEKPDLDDIVESLTDDDSLFVDGYRVFDGDPLLEPTKIFFYDDEDGSLMFFSGRGNPVSVDSPAMAHLSELVWSVIEERLKRGEDPVYLEKMDTNEIYIFKLAPKEMEDLGDDGTSDS